MCLEMKQLTGNSNSRCWVKKWAKSTALCLNRMMRYELTREDIADAKRFSLIAKKFLTEDGIILKEESLAQMDYFKRVVSLNKYKMSSIEDVISPNHFF